MKRVALLAIGSALVVACGGETGPSPLESPDFRHDGGDPGMVRVTTSADAGPGSFRQAVLDANGQSSIKVIDFKSNLRTISITQTVTYTGTQGLTISGNGAVVDGSGLGTGEGAFVADGGGNLDIRRLTVKNAPGVGITVAVPGAATGTQVVELTGLAILDNGSHGVLINDQAEYFIDPNSTSDAGSDASLLVRVTASRFANNGFTDLDQDGLRINEGGLGSLNAIITGAIVTGNGGDGIELDERNAGSALFEVHASALNRNGAFSSADFDDGMDVDEAGDGDIIGRFRLVTASDNFEQGLDLNENGPGNLNVDLDNVIAARNTEEGIEYEEDDDVAGGGDITANVRFVTTFGNGANDGDAGFKIREKGPGNLLARVSEIISAENAIGGIQIREDADGNLDAEIVNAWSQGNGGHGIEFDENSTGNLDAKVIRAVSSRNTGAGVAADQGGAGMGTLLLENLIAQKNVGGEFVVNDGVVVTQTN